LGRFGAALPVSRLSDTRISFLNLSKYVCIKKGKREFKKTLGNKIFINNIYILL